jgi:putative ABC transport system ATP-binding protein
MIVGPSGSGKTTLLNLIGCIDEQPKEPSSWRQDVGRLNDDAISDCRALRVGLIFQNFA